MIRIIEGFETVMFQSKFDSWSETSNVAASEDCPGKVSGQNSDDHFAEKTLCYHKVIVQINYSYSPHYS